MSQHLIYHGDISPQGARNTEALLTIGMQKGVGHFVLHLCSAGGDVNAGYGLYNFIRSLPVRVDTHAFGICDSIAATLFLAGIERTCVDPCAFVLHQASYREGPFTGQRSPNTDLIAAPFRSELGWPDADVARSFGPNDRRIERAEALSLRIVTSPKPVTLPSAASEIVCIALP